MKFALSTDQLLERRDVISVADIFCELYPETEGYAIAHRPGAILGPLESRKIHSTGLSKKIPTPEELSKNSFLVPTMSQQLFVPCSVKVIFNVTQGLSMGIPKCEKSYQISYLYDDYFLQRPGKSWRERLFSSYLKNWLKKSLSQVDELWVGSSRLKSQLKDFYKGEIQIVPPFIKLSEFPLIPSSIFKHDFYLVNAEDLDLKMARGILALLKLRSTRFRFIGNDHHLEELKNELPPESFFGERCAGELAPLMSSSRGLIDLKRHGFPKASIQCQATGRPVVALKGGSAEDFHQSPYVELVANLRELGGALDRLETSLKEGLDPKKVRAYAMDYHDLKFKGFLKRRMEAL